MFILCTKSSFFPFSFESTKAPTLSTLFFYYLVLFIMINTWLSDIPSYFCGYHQYLPGVIYGP